MLPQRWGDIFDKSSGEHENAKAMCSNAFSTFNSPSLCLPLPGRGSEFLRCPLQHVQLRGSAEARSNPGLWDARFRLVPVCRHTEHADSSLSGKPKNHFDPCFASGDRSRMRSLLLAESYRTPPTPQAYNPSGAAWSSAGPVPGLHKKAGTTRDDLSRRSRKRG